MEKCPGLKSVSGFKWWIPFGKESKDLTLCNACKPADDGGYTLSDTLSLCNCDGFLLNNKADNGIFNVSFWHNDEAEFYPVEPTMAEETNTYTLSLPAGARFKLFINGEGLKTDQFFQYDLLVNNVPLKKSADDQLCYYKKSLLDSQHFMALAAAPDPLLPVLREKYLLVDRQQLRIAIRVYQLQPMDINTSNQYYGDYVMLDHKTLGVKPHARPSKYLNLIRPDYKYTGTLIGQGLMQSFTTKPMVFTFDLKTHGASVHADNLVHKLIQDTNKDREKTRSRLLREQETYRALLAKSVAEAEDLRPMV